MIQPSLISVLRSCLVPAIRGLLVALLIGTAPARAAGQQETGDTPESPRPGYLIEIPLPVSETVAARVKQQISRIADQAPLVVAADKRPVLILEFDTSNGASGQGSDLGNCLDIAMLLTDKKLQGLHSVAYIPQARGFTSDDGDQPGSQLKGHAVLIALACNKIAMHQDTAIGQAGIDISGDSSLQLGLYERIAGRRRTVPLPVARALVDPSRSLFRVETSDSGVQFVDQDQLNRLETAGQVIESTTLVGAGELPLFSSQDLQQMRLIRYRVSSRADLARRLNIDRHALESSPAAGSEWQAVQLPIDNFVDSREADWTLRMLNRHLLGNPDTNLVIVRMNSPGGELDACLRIARELAALDPGKIRTAAFVESSARGPAALIAVACDQLIMNREGQMGGVGDDPATEQQLEDALPMIRRFAEQKQIDWSFPAALVDSGLVVARYRNRTTGQSRLLSEEERLGLDQPGLWIAVQEVDLANGLTGEDAARWGLSRTTLDDFDQVKQFYQLAETPVRLEPSSADRWIENLARDLASPWIAAWLLFGAVFLLSTEMSNPGVGIPGFLGTVCLMLFFWSQYLDGNAHWLEILLFVVGIVFVVLEMFVIPGFGVFGIGGLLMIVVSIVLASQTFIIPRNSEELAQLPVSLSLVLAASCGFLVGIFVIRKYLTTMPMFRRIMLNPPGSDQSVSPAQRDQRESLVDRSHMIGKTGQTVTPLLPAGKAQIGNELVDVITDGRMIERGQGVRVVDVIGNRVLVESSES